MEPVLDRGRGRERLEIQVIQGSSLVEFHRLTRLLFVPALRFFTGSCALLTRKVRE